MTRIMIVDDYDVARRGLRALIATRPRLEVVAEAATGPEALEQARQTSPDIAITSYWLPGFDGLRLTAQLQESMPSLQVLIYTMQRRESLILDFLQAGAHGIVLKTDPESYLLDAIDSLRIGRRYISSNIAEAVFQAKCRTRRTGFGGVTAREREVVRLIAEGRANKQIAGLLNLSIKTVECHRAAVMTKLNLRNTADLVRYALRNEIIAA